MRALLILALCILTALPAAAQDYKTILDLPEGWTLVNLSASEQVEIQQDLLIANLQYEAENTDPKALQNEINTVMKKAVDKALKVKGVKTATQGYNVYQYDVNRGKKNLPREIIWKGNQGLMIKSKDANALLDLTGELQKMGLSMNGLSYTVSPELLEETRNSLLEDALAKLKTKAERTAKALGKSKTELLQINVDHGGGYHAPVMRAMAMDSSMAKAEMAPPVAAPGETMVTLNVSAQAALKK